MTTLPESGVRAAEVAAARYARAFRWAELDDLRQEALVAVLRAARTWDATVGPFWGYAHCCASRACRELLYRQASPVSCRRGYSAELTDTRAVPVQDNIDIGEPADTSVFLDTLRRTVRERVLSTLGEDAAEILLTDEAPRETAHRLGVTPHHVYAVRQRAKRVLGADQQLRELWSES